MAGAAVRTALVIASFACGAAAAAPHAAPGEADYATYCAPCHGSAGNGDGPMARMLVPRPARHTDAALMNARSDEYLFRLLRDGGPALGKSALMGAWGGILSEQRLRDLVVVLRTLAAPVNRKASPEVQKKGADRLSSIAAGG